MMKNQEAIINTIQSIIDNIERDGLKRYDRIDIKFKPSLLKLSKKNVLGKYTRYLVLAIDEFFPITLRKILRIEKSIPPTTFTFLIDSMINIETYNINVQTKLSSENLMDKCLSQYLKEEENDCWWDIDIDPYMDVVDIHKRKTMHIHGLARCNMSLLNEYKRTGRSEYYDIAYRTINTTLRQHKLRRYRDGTISISYYPYTDDCTLNICSELCQWLAMVKSIRKTEEFDSILHDMIQLIINEQNENGSFPYSAKLDEVSKPGKTTVDCHHSATVLRNLIEVVKEDVLSLEQIDELKNTINKGMGYFLDNFIDFNTFEIKGRNPGPTQYGEAIITLCKYIKDFPIGFQDIEIINRINGSLNGIIQKMIKFVNQKNGSCPSEKVVKWQYLNSIRWGNGVILNALTEYIATRI